MSISRWCLLVIGICYLACGFAYLAFPTTLAAFMSIELATPLSIIEVQGFYGGQLVGLGAFVLIGVRIRSFSIPALVLIAANLGGTAFGRIVGVILEGSVPPAILMVLIVEVVVTIAAVGLAYRERKSTAA